MFLKLVEQKDFVFLMVAMSDSLMVVSLLLALVMSPIGLEVNGAARWIHLGPINLQPSEFAKPAIVVVLAHYLACNEGRMRDVAGIVVPTTSEYVTVS